jgi:four helix bundle protein
MKALQTRTRRFAIDTFRFCGRLPGTSETRVIRGQLLRCASSVGANYRAACRARSRSEFVAKLGLVEEEADECQYWLELLRDLNLGPSDGREALHREAGEIVRIIVTSIKTARRSEQ